MEKFVKGDIVVVPFPFSDFSNLKKRPALIVANLDGDDFILSQITSVVKSEKYSLELNKKDFEEGKLKFSSIIRPDRLVTIDQSMILYKVGKLKKNKIKIVEENLVNIFSS
ncbi:MAG: type II toxin-antitoxin system PemK/MazF family toxin [Nanoarchaeota archaeon]|nr:type II toxin-antitoxin system PemK/MazF family toxin [Nanoarchaeota archaeon]